MTHQQQQSINLLPEGDSSQMYDAIVAPVGGDFTSIAAAFDSGAATVFVRSGTYQETDSINIPGGGCLTGTAPGTVTIILLDGAQILIDGTGRLVVGGTISVTSGTTTVTGVGTTFTGLESGDFIALVDGFYEISSITDDLSLELLAPYEGKSLAAETMQGQSMLVAASVTNVGIAAPGNTAIVVNQAFRCFFRGVGVQSSGLPGLPVLPAAAAWNVINSGNVTIQSCGSDNNLGVGLFLGGTITPLAFSRGCFVLGCSVRNNGGNGVVVAIASQCIFDSCEVLANGGAGIFYGVTNRIQVLDSFINNNSAQGVTAIFLATQNLIGNCTIRDNGTQGIEFTGGNSNVIDACIIESNGANGINGGADAIVDGCHVKNNTLIGIDLQAASDNVTISSNVVDGNGGDGILSSGQSTVIGNRVRNNGGIGIDLMAAADDVTIVGNNVTGNTSDGVRITAGSARCVFTGNTTRLNGGTNFNDLSTTTVVGANQTA